jgi:hypothetical protein
MKILQKKRKVLQSAVQTGGAGLHRSFADCFWCGGLF